jgi:hypothetical protein
MIFADLHCHPAMYPFNHMRNDPAREGDPSQFHPWRSLPVNLKAMARGSRASSYSQCDMPKLVRGKVRIAFASITPIEQGFFGLLPHDEGHRPFVRELVRWVTGGVLREAARHWRRGDALSAGRALAGVVRNRGPLRLYIQHLFTRYHMGRVRHFVSDRYDYWDEFLREYDFYRAADSRPHAVTFQRPHAAPPHGPVSEHVEGTYHLIRDAAHLKQVVEGGDPTELAIILTIEGAHTFSIAPDQRRVPTPVLFERIQALKALPHPILFVTFAHHFDNGLCGHARSLINSARMVMDQSRRLNEGFEASEDNLGLRAALALLDLDADLNDLGGRRIHLDLKHASARTRQALYAQVYKPYNARLPEGATKLPVIFSHAAYADTRTLDDFISHLDDEQDTWRKHGFYAWSINACDEDIRMVHATDGLFGLCFDQRILGVRDQDKLPPKHWSVAMMRQLLAVVDVIMLDERIPADQRATIWDRICIGSDYDGFIDPLSAYPTALALPEFARDLRDFLHTHRHTRQIDALGVEALTERLCWRNAYNFALKHLPAQAPASG